METNKNDTSDEITIAELFEKEKEEERKNKRKKYRQEYNSRPVVKKRRAKNYERIAVKRTEERMAEEFRNMGKINPHKICKKLGNKSMKSISETGTRNFKCRTCAVTYTDKQKKYFWRNHYCPCCHRKLSIRKTVSEKRK